MNRTFFAGALAAAALSFSASAAPVFDTYIGGNAAGFGDIVGQASVFDVRSFDAQRTGMRLQVVIDTAFAGNAGVFPALTTTAASGGRGIGYGDLFLAGDWNPLGPAPYTGDNHVTGTHWTYAFSLDDRWSATGGSGRLYRLNGATNNANTLLSNDFISSGGYRRGQVVAVDRASSTVEQVGTGEWTVDGANDRLQFNFDLAGTALADDNTLALHWDMSCGNDVIEGVAHVPAPAAAPLFALGALLGLLRRRRAGM